MKPCKVCKSLHRAEYEKLRLVDKLLFKELVQIARNKYNENITASTFSRHFRKHVEPILKAEEESRKLRSKLIKERMESAIQATNEIIKYLQTLSNQLSQVADKLEDPEARKETREIIRTADSVLNTALKYKDELTIHDQAMEEDIYDRFRYAIEKLPAHLQRECLERFDSYAKHKL